jgi:hypothetical protein
MKTRRTAVIGGILIGMATLATSGLVGGPWATAAAGGVPMVDQGVVHYMATPESDHAQMTEKMEQMIDECLTMMKNMNAMMGMMGGDMSGMRGGEGMDEMPQVSATPGA